jgi:hypothetical protein
MSSWKEVSRDQLVTELREAKKRRSQAEKEASDAFITMCEILDELTRREQEAKCSTGQSET